MTDPHATAVTDSAVLSRRESLGLLASVAGAGIAAAFFGLGLAEARAETRLRSLVGLSPAELGWDPQRGEFVLPPLRYPYDAIEPAIDRETMRLHHSMHHASYVRGLNGALSTLRSIRAGDDATERVQAVSRDLAFHGSGHVLHVLFWLVLRPTAQESGREPSDALRERLERDFGSMDAFTDAYLAAALAAEGSGWAILAHEPVADRLVIMSAEKHQDLTIHGPGGLRPILPCDVWEHAYYLKYQNRRGDYVRAFLGAVDWGQVETLLRQSAVP